MRKTSTGRTRRVAVYLETHCNISLKKAFTAIVLDRWHNCILIYWRTSCLSPPHSTIPSVTCLRLSDDSVICRVTYFQFPIQSTFLQYIAHLAAPEPHLWLWAAPALQHTIGQYRTTDVAENLGKSLSAAQRTSHGKHWSDSNSKQELIRRWDSERERFTTTSYM